MTTGRVKFFSKEKGYGFITIDSGESDLFVHISEVKDDIKVRDRVAFEIVEEKNRKKAINVTLLIALEERNLREGTDS